MRYICMNKSCCKLLFWMYVRWEEELYLFMSFFLFFCFLIHHQRHWLPKRIYDKRVFDDALSQTLIPIHALPETMRLPCAETFAVGKTSSTQQRQGLPCATRTGTWQSCSTRQSKDLPCARRNGPRQRSGTQQTMHLCRVPNLRHTAKMVASDDVWPTVPFAVCLNKARGKDSICRVFYFVHTAKVYQNSWILTP